MSDTPTNRKPADRLAAIREQIRVLKVEEATIRKGLVDGELDLEGDDYVAVVTAVTNERIDLRTMRQHVEESIWRPFLIEKDIIYVKTVCKPGN